MIIFCHLLNDNSGSPNVLKATIEAMTFHRESVRLFIGSQGSGLLDLSGVPTKRYWYRRSSFRPVTFLSYFFSQFVLFFSLAIGRIPPKAIIFVNTLLPFGAMIWGKLTGRPVIVHVHEVSISPKALNWFLLVCASKCADQLIYVSKDHLRRLPINGPPSLIIYNPVSSYLASNASVYSSRKTGKFNVLMLASLKAYKGIDEFIDLSKGMADYDEITFTLVLNADLHEVKGFIKKFRDLANVNIYPRTNDPSNFYECADLVINLSRIDQQIETFGLTVVEAMTFGIPVIVPPIGGPAEIIKDGCEGFCIDSRDIKSLHKAVLSLFTNPLKAMEMSGAALKCAQKFTFTEYSQKITAIINAYKN